MVASDDLTKLRGRPARSPEEVWLPEGFHAIRWLKCAWADRYSLVDELGAYGGQLYPYNTAIGARAYTAKVYGMGRVTYDASGLAQYEFALLAVSYSTAIPQIYGTNFISEAIEPYRDYGTVDAAAAGLRWESVSGDAIDGGLGIMHPGFAYVLSYHHSFYAPVNMGAYVGYCNASNVATYGLGWVFSAQTLLHADPMITHTVRLGGMRDYQLRYTWYFRASGWNKKWRADAGQWQTVYHPDYGQVIFHPTIDFNALRP